MGIILGFLCLLCCCLLLAKMLTRKFHLGTADKVMMKLHKPASGGLALFCLLHILFAAPVFSMRHISVSCTGMGIVIFSALAVLLCHVMKEQGRRLRWHRILSAALFLCLLGHIGFYYWDFNGYQDKISKLQIQGIDLAQIEDGKYAGTCDAGYIFAKVEVTVERGRISDINILEHRNEKGNAAEKIVDVIVSQQQVDVDVVSGATNSSKVIEKAVENALLSYFTGIGG